MFYYSVTTQCMYCMYISRIQGVGTVVSGTCMQGVIHLGDTLLLGPTWNGEFQPVPIRSIHRKRLPVREVRGGQTASFALKKYKRNAIHKGMVMVASGLNPQACWEFEGDILILHHPTTISTKYQAMGKLVVAASVQHYTHVYDVHVKVHMYLYFVNQCWNHGRI